MLKPLNNNIIFVKETNDLTTQSGILLPTTNNNSNIGKVIAVSDGTCDSNGVLRPLTVKENDRVVFSPNYVMEIEFDGTTYYSIDEKYVIAVII